MRYDHCLFGATRDRGLRLWAEETNRDCGFVNDDMTRSYECEWQDRAVEGLGYEHISIFCSLGEWANNISDILKNPSCDYYDLLDEDHRLALFRYYTRFLLVVSEMLCDFEEMVQKLTSSSSKQAREFLSKNKGEIGSVFGYINQVCKHKVGAMHRCNHHLPIWLEDCGQPHPFSKPVSIGNLDFEQPDGILMPRLGYFIGVVLHCYQSIDAMVGSDLDGFRMICDEYNGSSYLE